MLERACSTGTHHSPLAVGVGMGGVDSVSEGAAEPGPQPPASATSAQDTEAAPAVAPVGSEAPPAVRTLRAAILSQA